MYIDLIVCLARNYIDAWYCYEVISLIQPYCTNGLGLSEELHFLRHQKENCCLYRFQNYFYYSVKFNVKNLPEAFYNSMHGC